MIKILLCDFSSLILRDVALELKKYGAEIVYWTGCKTEFEIFSKDKISFPNTIFHNVFDAVRGIPAPDMDMSGFEPPGIDMITEMLECESITLSMMARMDFGNTRLAKKKALYYTYLQYWNGVLKTLKPDVVIFPHTPHAVYNFVIYSLAKKYNIPAIMFGVGRFQENWLLTDDYKKTSEDLFNEYNKIKEERHSVEELNAAWQEDLRNLLDSNYDAISLHTTLAKKRYVEIKKPLRMLPSFSAMVKSAESGVFFRNVRVYFRSLIKNNGTRLLNIDSDDDTNYKSRVQLKKMLKIKKEFRKEYLDVQSDVDLANNNEKFIYFPLHYQPELTTSPLAGYFVDQILMVKILSASVPPDWKVYVRENVLQWAQDDNKAHMLRYGGYYRQLAAMKNVKLISTDLPTLELVAKSQAVAVATGTAGWEALVKGRPVLYFGYPWYMHCHGAMKVSDVKSCKESIQKVIGGFKPELQKVINYAIAAEKLAVKGTWDDFQYWNKAKPEETVKNLTNAILKQLSKIKLL